VALAGTYDPDELAKMKVVGLQPNVEEARKWYERARELGAFEAAERLRRLGAR
jgi:TPR repeat protein